MFSRRSCFAWLTLSLAASILFASACGGAEQSDFEAAKARWETAEPQRYSMRASIDGFLPGEPIEDARVTVENGSVVEAIGWNRETSEHSVPLAASDYQTWYTVDGLFDVIDDALDNADVVNVVYDEVTGIPLSVDITFVEGRLDDGLRYQLRDFMSES